MKNPDRAKVTKLVDLPNIGEALANDLQLIGIDLHKKQADIARAREYLTKALNIPGRLGTLNEPDKVREELAALGEV